MPVRIPPESVEAQERRKWEAFPTEFGAPGRPFVFYPYPTMLHKAGRRDGITPDIVDSQIATNDNEKANLMSRGFCESPADAITLLHATELEHAKLAAERNFDVKNRLSAKAGAEVEAAEAGHDGHLPSVPVTSIRPRRPSLLKHPKRTRVVTPQGA